MMKPETSIIGQTTTGLCGPAAVALVIKGVSHSYGPRKALDNVSFEVAARQLYRATWP